MKIQFLVVLIFISTFLFSLSAQNSKVKFPLYSLWIKFEKPDNMALITGLQNKIKFIKIRGSKTEWFNFLDSITIQNNAFLFYDVEERGKGIYFHNIIDTTEQKEIMSSISIDSVKYFYQFKKEKIEIFKIDSGISNIGKYYSIDFNYSIDSLLLHFELYFIKARSSTYAIAFCEMEHKINLSIINSIEFLYPSEFEKNLIELNRIYWSKDWKRYEAKVDEVILSFPENPLLNTSKIGILLFNKKYNEALVLADKILTNDVLNINGFICKAIALYKLGKLNESIHNFDIALSYIDGFKSTNDQNEYYVEVSTIKRFEGEIYLQLGEFEKARKNLEESLHESVDSLEIAYNYKNLGIIHFELRYFDSAIDNFELAKKWIPDNNDYEKGQIYLFNGITMQAIKDYKSAIKEFNSVLKYDPKNEMAIIQIGISKQNQKDYNGAIIYFTEIINKNPNSQIAKKALYRRGCAKIASGKEGCDDLKKAMKLGIKDDDGYFDYYCKEQVIKK